MELGPLTSQAPLEELGAAEFGRAKQLAVGQLWQGRRRHKTACGRETKSNTEELTERELVAVDTERQRQPLRRAEELVPDVSNRTGVRTLDDPGRAAEPLC